MKDILDIHIEITDVAEVQGSDALVKMLAFTGRCAGEYFKGRVLPGGMDVQTIRRGGTGTVSARYMLEGTDTEEKLCKIYVENTGIIDENGNMLTTPKLVTNSEALGWLQQEKLCCRFEMRGKEFHVILGV